MDRMYLYRYAKYDYQGNLTTINKTIQIKQTTQPKHKWKWKQNNTNQTKQQTNKMQTKQNPKQTPHLEKVWTSGGSYGVCWGEGDLLPYCLWIIHVFIFCDLVFTMECNKMYFSARWDLKQLLLTDLLQNPIVSHELWLNVFAIDVALMCYMNYLSYLSAVKLEALSHSVLSRLKWKPVFMVQEQWKKNK